MSKIVVKQTKSLIAVPSQLRKVMAGLGLGKIGQVKTHKDNNCIRGMINKVNILLNMSLFPSNKRHNK